MEVAVDSSRMIGYAVVYLLGTFSGILGALLAVTARSAKATPRLDG